KAHAATEGQPADAGVADRADRVREPMFLRRRTDVTEQRTAAASDSARLRVDRHSVELGQLDHQPAVDNRLAGDAVRTPAYGDLEAGVDGVPHRVRDVLRRDA